MLIHVSDSWLQATDAGQYVRGYDWLKNFLCRSQQVNVQNTLSSRGLITIGVPQGPL